MTTPSVEPTFWAAQHRGRGGPGRGAERPYNLSLSWYWFESVAGWILAAIAIAGVANLIRRE